MKEQIYERLDALAEKEHYVRIHYSPVNKDRKELLLQIEDERNELLTQLEEFKIAEEDFNQNEF